MIKGFREFIMRGNVVDLAVAVVIGAAFAQVVDALINGLLTPLIAAIFGEPNLDSVGVVTINEAVCSIGVVLTAVIQFLLIAGAIYFAVIAPMNALAARRRRGEPTDEPAEASEEVVLLTEIRDALRNRAG